MKFLWFNQKELVSFWQPITNPSMRWWRDLHIKAHLLGGMVWDTLFHFVVVASPQNVWLDLRFSVVNRLLVVGLWQLTAWEMVQKENWRPELMTPPGKPEDGYPWLSAIWDVLFTVAGAAVFELAWYLIERVGGL